MQAMRYALESDPFQIVRYLYSEDQEKANLGENSQKATPQKELKGSRF